MIAPLGPGSPAAISDLVAPKRPADARDAASQFEALLIGQMLRAVRESGGWLGTSDPSGDCATEYAEQQLAAVIAAHGGLGLGTLIAKGLDAADSGQDREVSR
jgi:Rod binding domain-containing protein